MLNFASHVIINKIFGSQEIIGMGPKIAYECTSLLPKKLVEKYPEGERESAVVNLGFNVDARILLWWSGGPPTLLASKPLQKLLPKGT